LTDRAIVLTVLLDATYREDDLQALMQAIGMLKHVRRVTHESCTGFEDEDNDIIFTAELRKEILAILTSKTKT